MALTNFGDLFMYRKFLLTVVILLLPSICFAQCYGTDNYKQCYDSGSGNSYSVQKYGNTTTMNGTNSRTGSNWNQRSTTYGNTTYNSGTAANGNSWNTTTARTGGSTYTNGTDSSGNSISCYSNAYGSSCN
jgi:hypothetical protein